MTYPTSYKLKVTGANPSNSSQDTVRWADIHSKKANLTVQIHGGDRSISTEVENKIYATVHPISANISYRWSCIDQSSLSFCLNHTTTVNTSHKVYISKRYRYLDFPNAGFITLPAKSLESDKTYKIALEVEDTSTNITSRFFTMIQAVSGNSLSISIDSRENQDGYIDYSQDSLFVGLPTINGTGVDISKSSFSWTLTDSLGNTVDLTSALKVQNSLKIPAWTLSMNQIYILSLNVTSANTTGSVSISYNTHYDSKYSFEVSLTSGSALSTEFIISAVSQEINSLLTSFIFGYTKGGVDYYLTRNSPIPTHRVQLPQGETSNELTLFLVVSNNDEQFRFQRKVTVSAPTITASDFMNELNTVFPNSVDESMNIYMKYLQFKDSLGGLKLTA